MTEKDSTGSAVEPQTLIESADQSPKRADYAEWIDWTNALAEWVLNQHELGKMSIGRLACVFDLVEFHAKGIIAKHAPKISSQPVHDGLPLAAKCPNCGSHRRDKRFQIQNKRWSIIDCDHDWHDSSPAQGASPQTIRHDHLKSAVCSLDCPAHGCENSDARWPTEAQQDGAPQGATPQPKEVMPNDQFTTTTDVPGDASAQTRNAVAEAQSPRVEETAKTADPSHSERPE